MDGSGCLEGRAKTRTDGQTTANTVSDCGDVSEADREERRAVQTPRSDPPQCSVESVDRPEGVGRLHDDDYDDVMRQ